MITEEMIEKAAEAAQAKRDELIAQPLARVWGEISRAALEAAYPLIAAQVLEEAEFRAIVWDAVAEIASRRASEARSEVNK